MALLDNDEFCIGIFGMNAGGGAAMTRVPERWQLDWSKLLDVARLVDTSGIDFILPLARWRGYGGDTNPTGDCFETFTFASAIAAVTRKITIFSTVHVPFIHPVFAARSATTIDHLSNGRFGLNIVCGWSEDEFKMFGLYSYDPDQRYAHGEEWLSVFGRLTSEGIIDRFEGKFFSLDDARCMPVSVQRPRPIVMSAAFSPTGRQFAAQNCDILFSMHSSPEKSRAQNAQFLEEAGKFSRAPKIFTIAHVVCRETDAEAESYYKHFADEMADNGAVEYFSRGVGGAQSSLAPMMRRARMRVAGGAGSVPIVGSADNVANQIIQIKQAGFAGIGLSFVNYEQELPYFIERALPQIRAAI